MKKTEKPIIRVAETFTLRKIPVKDITAKYLAGNYNNRPLTNNKIRTSTAALKVGRETGFDFSSEIYRFSDKHNTPQTILTTNHALYKYHECLQNGKVADVPLVKCKYCKRKITKAPIGLPVAMELSSNNNNTNTSSNSNTNNQYVTFYVIDIFCDFGCAFTFLKRRNGESRIYRDTLYMNAEQMLYCMYYRMYPDKIGASIREKPDWELLRENGGLLNDEEFDSDTTDYVSVPSLVILPAKKQYMRLNIKNVRE